MASASEYARERIQENLRRLDDSLNCSCPETNEDEDKFDSGRLQSLSLRGESSRPDCENKDERKLGARKKRDGAALALLKIAADAVISRDGQVGSGNDVACIAMNSVDPVPRYDAWVPVSKEFWVGNEFMVEPYMPWFGDEEDKRGNAFDLYRRMAKLVNDDTEVSDGEMDENGNFIEPSDDEEAWVVYDSVSEQRRRASCRAAIVAVADKFGRDRDEVLNALAFALNLGDKRRVLKMLEIAESRQRQSFHSEKRRKEASVEAKRVADAWDHDVGYGDYNEEWYVDEALAPLVYFCFTCHVFYCPRHLNHNVEPIVPIKDSYIEMRQSALKRFRSTRYEDCSEVEKATGLKPCGSDCHLLNPWEAAPVGQNEACLIWSKKERLLLKEGISIFKRDPCCISEVLGKTKSCRQVAAYLQRPSVAALSNRLIAEATKKRWPLETNRGGRMRAQTKQTQNDRDSAGSRNEESDIPLSEILGRHSMSKSSRSLSGSLKGMSKSCSSDDSADETDASQEADFVPCAHPGPCDRAVCSCYAKNLKCEATCGCNTGRWTMCGYETPMSKAGTADKKKVCKRRHWGCSCEPDSHCNTSSCECWEERRSCDPDFCDHCQANILPSQISSDSRGCRNVGVPIGRHKRTIIGKSSVHGYGLFAGEVFEKGDLVGIYGGQIMDTKKADSLGFLYDAKDHTFFFDVTQSLVVDGGVLGMKSKFVNHVQGGSPEENCQSRCVRVRGTAHIALFATRRVEVGEEFRFDYKFQDIVPDWAQPKGDDDLRQEPLEKRHELYADRKQFDGLGFSRHTNNDNANKYESHGLFSRSISDGDDDDFILERR